MIFKLIFQLLYITKKEHYKIIKKTTNYYMLKIIFVENKLYNKHNEIYTQFCNFYNF
jgi:hypothetical protein